jgi:hypothetical protein
MKFFKKAEPKMQAAAEIRELSENETQILSGGSCVEKPAVCRDTGGGHIVCSAAVVCSKK